MQSLHGRQDERVLHELKEWQNSFIDVQTLMDSLAVSRGRVRDLQEKVCNLLHAGKRHYVCLRGFVYHTAGTNTALPS